MFVCQEEKTDNSNKTNDDLGVVAQKWVNPECYYIDCLTCESNSIEVRKNVAEIYGQQQVQGVFQLTVTFNRSNHCCIGLAHQEYTYMKYGGKYYLYLENNGYLIEQSRVTNVNSSKGFIANQMVSIMGDLNKSQIQWVVDGKLVYQLTIKPEQKDVKWVPYIRAYNGCKIHIIQSLNNMDLLCVFIAKNLYEWDDDLLYELHKILDLDLDMFQKTEHQFQAQTD